MKRLLSLLLLLAAPAVSAVERDIAQPIRGTQPGLSAHIGAEHPQNVQDSEVLVFDSYTGASLTFTTGVPRTYTGLPFNLGNAAGNDPAISKVVVYLVYAGAEAQTYDRLRVRIQFWDRWSTGRHVFSDPAAALYEADVAGPVTLDPNTSTAITLALATPISLTGLDAHGIVVNFQGDTGSGLASSDNLTSLLRNGAPIAVGANGLGTGFGYRNVASQTTFNHQQNDVRSIGGQNQAVALQLYATAGAIAQRINNFAATPADPVVGTGSFTVSATGGGSGNPVIFSVDPASAVVCASGGTNGATITILGAGTCTVRANQTGDASFNPAPQRSLPVTVGNPGGLVQDGGFEAGIVPTHWTQASTNFGSPMCGADCNGVGPRSGAFWTWLGGATAAEVSAVEQAGVIRAGMNTLNFYLWWSTSVTSPPDPAATFTVKIDGNTVFTLTPATAAAYSAGYALASVDVSGFADGNTHTLRFESSNAAAASATNIHLDDINLSGTVSDVVFADGFQ